MASGHEALLDKLDVYKYSSGSIKNNLHGHIYQVELLMLYAYRGWKNGKTFCLATEMADAGKFDDIVIWYTDKNKDKEECIYLECLQVKHSWITAHKIGKGDLLDDNDGDYSLAKYFNSYRRIKENLVVTNESKLKACSICTNTQLDVKDRKISDTEILIDEAEDVDEFLQILRTENLHPTPKRYKLLSGCERNSGIYKRLRKLSDTRVLAKELARCVWKENSCIPYKGLFEYYHPALGTKVIDSNTKTFYKDFREVDRDDAWTDMGQFRKHFLEECWKLIDTEAEKPKRRKYSATPNRRTTSSGCIDESMVWSVIENNLKTLSVFPDFGKKYEPVNGDVNEIEKFSFEFSELIKDSGINPNQIVVDRARGGIIKKYFNKLYGRVFEVKDKKIKFTQDFLNGSSKLRWDMQKFRECLRKELRDNFNDLKNSYILVRNSDDCWKKFFSTSELPDSSNNIDGEIDDFLDKFVLMVGQPDEIKLGELITEEIRVNEELNPREADFVSNSFQKKILDWCKKKSKQPEFKEKYFTDKDVDNFFKSVLKENHNDNPIYTRLRTDSGNITNLESEEQEESVPEREEESHFKLDKKLLALLIFALLLLYYCRTLYDCIYFIE